MPYTPIGTKARDHGPSIKNPATYEALIAEKGMSKGQAAAISNGAMKKGERKGVHHQQDLWKYRTPQEKKNMAKAERSGRKRR